LKQSELVTCLRWRPLRPLRPTKWMESARSETTHTHCSSTTTTTTTASLSTLQKLPEDGEQEPSVLVPPYWQHPHAHHDSAVNYSSENLAVPQPIRLEDHSEDGSEQCKALWAKQVSIDDYVVVSGNAPGIGAYVVWNCTVQTLNVCIVRYGFLFRMLPFLLCRRCNCSHLHIRELFSETASPLTREPGRADEDNETVL